MDNSELIKQGLDAFKDDDFRYWAGQFINEKPWRHNTEYVYKWFGSQQVVDGVRCTKCGEILQFIDDNSKFDRYSWERACSILYCYLQKDSIHDDCRGLSHWMMSYVLDPRIWILISCIIINEQQYEKDILDNKAPDPVHEVLTAYENPTKSKEIS